MTPILLGGGQKVFSFGNVNKSATFQHTTNSLFSFSSNDIANLTMHGTEKVSRASSVVVKRLL